jgi:cobalt-precorrin 5A hydrolase/cobalt-precorrin 5A hydrolase/precorrin-3B C17-methyltransferase
MTRRAVAAGVPRGAAAMTRRAVAAGVPRGAAAARLVVGAGCSLGCSADELGALVAGALAGVEGTPVVVATIDRRAGEPCVTALAAALRVPVVTFTAEALAGVPVPSPSAVVARHVRTPSVAEAAALLASGGELVVHKRRSPHATCAVAKEPSWRA